MAITTKKPNGTIMAETISLGAALGAATNGVRGAFLGALFGAILGYAVEELVWG